MDCTSLVLEHRRNLAPERIAERVAFDSRYASYADSAYRTLVGEPRGKALSLGCGLGFDVRELASLGWDAYGSEVADLREEWAGAGWSDGERLRWDPSGRIPFPAESFNLIICLNVLEHVGTVPPEERVTKRTSADRAVFINQAIDALAPGGLLVLTCPNRAYPFDASHSHHYLPGGWQSFGDSGYCRADPFHPQNFLPAPHEIAEAVGTRNIGGALLDDNSLFGGAGPEQRDPDYATRVEKYADRWCASRRLPRALACNPHIQAFLRRGHGLRITQHGIWTVTWTVGNDVFTGTLTRRALSDEFQLALSAGARREFWSGRMIGNSVVETTGGALFDLLTLTATAPVGTMTITWDKPALHPLTCGYI